MFFFLFSTLDIQALFGVQLLIEFYMKNMYKNIRIVKQASFDQDLRTNNICNLNKTLAKPTCNIETKTNNTIFVANLNSCA
jgi:hypothetical protein